MARHLELKHADKLDVAKVLAKPKGSRDRREGFLYLIRVGDFYHNMEVLAAKQGQLILARRPQNREEIPHFNFGPCPYCLGFMLKSALWHHVRVCQAKKARGNDEAVKTTVTAESNAMVNSILFSEHNQFVENILNNFKNDHVSNVCKNDGLIRMLGMIIFEKHGNSQHEYIRQTMRQMGRLLLEIREISETYRDRNLSFFIHPNYFDTVICAVKNLCRATMTDHGRTQYEIPSLALKIGHSLRKCVGLLRGQSLRAGLLNENENLKSFLELLDLEWTCRISSSALNTMIANKMNCAEVLPLTEDLMKLNKYIAKEIAIFAVLLKKNPEEKYAWIRLAEALLARIILFNKRRSGEASKLTINQFLTETNWKKECTGELWATLSKFERELARRQKLIQIVGKRGRVVPIILTEDVTEGIKLLISTRSSIGVNVKNIYVFARINNSSIAHMRGSDALRNCVSRADLKQPSSMTGTKLRKYIATVSQVLNLKNNELDWLARHLGHDIRVHRDFIDFTSQQLS
nr:unnamed protein product [Callosobruchus chinensis]